MKKNLIGLSIIVILMSFPLVASDKNAPLTEAEKKDMMKNQQVTLPSAGALANSLKKALGDIKWAKFIDVKATSMKYNSLEDRALHLGARGADAYFLAFSKDVSNLKAVSSDIKSTLNGIHLKGKALSKIIGNSRLQSLQKSINAKAWPVVLKEISSLKDKINEKFEEANQNNLQTLNNIGGWLEGYRLAVEGFKVKYNAKHTVVLVQDDLVKFLIKEINGLKSYSKKGSIAKILSDIKGVLANTKNNTLTKTQVEELSKILSRAKTVL